MGMIGSIGAAKGAGQQADAAKAARKQYEELHQEGKAVRKQVDSWSTVKRGENGESGVEAAGASLYDLLFGGGAYEMSPAAKFAQDQGQKSIRRQASSTGMRASGNVLHQLGEFTTGVASQDYWQNINNLMSLSGANNMANTAQMQLSNSQVAVKGKADAEMALGAARAAKTGAMFSGIESAVTGAMTGGMGGGGFAGALGGIFGAA